MKSCLVKILPELNRLYAERHSAERGGGEIMRLVKRCSFCSRLLRVKNGGFFRDTNSGRLYLMTFVRCKSCGIASEHIKAVGIRRGV